jgi:hypothetical protein
VAHHESIMGRGMGLKASDHEVVPLCMECHKRRHDMGKITFWGQMWEAGEIDFELLKRMWRYRDASERG